MTAVYSSTKPRKSNGVCNGVNAAKSELNPNQNNQPNHEQTMNDFNKPLDGKKQLQGMMNDTPTPRTNEWETYCDECYYHMWRVRRKNERGFDDGFHVQNGEGARQLVELLNKQDEELTAVTEQRDKLAEALIKCREDSVCEQVRMEKCRYTKAAAESQANIDRADKALQSLTPNNDR
jgi:hypothetical protein